MCFCCSSQGRGSRDFIELHQRAQAKQGFAVIRRDVKLGINITIVGISICKTPENNLAQQQSSFHVKRSSTDSLQPF
jgi:hypothetical protein